MALSPAAAKDLIMLGCNMTFADGGYSPDTLKEIVMLSKAHGSQITIHSKNYSPDTLKQIVMLGKERVTIVV